MEKTSSDGRIFWADWAKSVGIFLVVLAHTQLYEPLQNWIYVFHMPLFFFISGFLFSFDRHRSLKSFACVRFRQLIVPYVSFNVVSWLVWLLVLRHYGSQDDSGTAWWNPLFNAALGNGDLMAHNVPLWFFLCLYIVELAYWVFFRSLARLTVMVCFAVAGLAVYAFCPVRLPFSSGTALVGVVFYAAGQQVRDAGCGRNVIAAIAALCVTLAVAWGNGRINMHVNYYGNYLLFVTGAFAGIYLIYYICGFFGRCRAVEYISRNTLTVCGVHMLTFPAVKFVMIYAMGISPGVLSATVWPNVLFASVGMALSLAAAWVINAYFPFITGRYRRR